MVTLGDEMSDRSWFLALDGQQHGPYPEAQLREFIADGRIAADTLVWTEGMADWQKAGDIPGLFARAAGPPGLPRSGGPPAAAGGYDSGTLSIDVGLWDLLGRGLLVAVGFLLVIPAPWAATNFYGWMISRLRVPERPNLGFTGQVGDIWYVFVVMALLTYLEFSGIRYLRYIVILVDGYLSWMLLRWIAANFSSDGRQLPIAFDGNALTYVGWHVLIALSFVTIIGWAWVATAWTRWICRNVSGTRREILFNATGLEMLWRTIVFSLASVLIIPIPWVLRWYTLWYVSQFELVERTA
jgi:GYF domain 2